MNIRETKLKGCFIIEPSIYKDSRGLFYESYHKTKFEEAIGKSVSFVQDNISFSKKGVLRGLHFQKGEFSQAKLVQVLKGEVLDVVVDIRKDSTTFGQYVKMKISSDNKKNIFIPKGMAHGFLALTEDVVFSYKCDNFYNPKAESGIVYNDPSLNIAWEFPEEEIILSDKDLELLLLNDLDI